MEHFDIYLYALAGNPCLMAILYERIMVDWKHHIFQEDGVISWEGYLRRYKEQVEILILNFSTWHPEDPRELSIFLNQVVSARMEGWQIRFSLDEP